MADDQTATGGQLDGVDELGGLDELTLAVRDMIGAAQQVTSRMAQAMRQNPNDMAAIGMLVALGPMGVVELADRLGIRSASATALVDRLERAGHAERVRDTVDRRRVVVVATDAARRANLLAWAPLIRRIDRACRGLSAAERPGALRLLAVLTATYQQAARSAADG